MRGSKIALGLKYLDIGEDAVSNRSPRVSEAALGGSLASAAPTPARGNQPSLPPHNFLDPLTDIALSAPIVHPPRQFHISISDACDQLHPAKTPPSLELQRTLSK